MQFFYCFLFVCLFTNVNLCSSFTLVNKQITPKIISRDIRNKLNMGCDYYIDKDLHIYDYNDKQISSITIEHIKGYYWFGSSFDEDDNRHLIEFEKYKKQLLETRMEPIIIYSNNTFNTLSFEEKYEKIIENEIKIFNKTLNDVNKVVKIENRYERL